MKTSRAKERSAANPVTIFGKEKQLRAFFKQLRKLSGKQLMLSAKLINPYGFSRKTEKRIGKSKKMKKSN